MNDLDTRIRDTLERVAQTASTPSRLDELTSRHRRRVLAPAVAALALAVGALAVTSILLTGGGSPRAPTGEGSSISPAPGGVEPSWLIVEPEDIAAIVEATDDERPDGSYVPGTRPPLRSEAAWCVDGAGRPWHGGSALRNLALDVPLTEEALVEACLTTAGSSSLGWDGWNPAEPGGYTVCRGRYPNRDGLWDPPTFVYPGEAELVLVAGDPAAAGPGFPVLFDRVVDCATISVPEGLLIDDVPMLEDLNRARDLEIASLGAALRSCLSVEQARALAAAVHAELGSGWLLVEVSWVISTMENRFGGPVGSDTARADCHGPLFDYEHGFVAGPSATPPAPNVPPATFTTLSPDQVGGVGD